MKATPKILEKLTKLEIFSDFASGSETDIRILKKVCDKLEFRDFPSGAIIINEGDDGDNLYILFEGVVQVLRNTPSSDRFAVVNLASEQNVFFGEVALIDRDKRSASVVAQTACRTLSLNGKDFTDLCNQEPLLGYKACFKIAKRLAGSLRRSTSDILTLYDALLDEVEGANNK